MPVGDFMVGVKRTALDPGELIVSSHGAGGRRLAGLREGRRPQRDGHRGRECLRRPRPHGSQCARWRSARSDRRSCAVPTPSDHLSASIDWDTLAIADAEASDRFGDLVSQASRPITDHRSTAEYRRHAVGVLARRLVRRASESSRARLAPARTGTTASHYTLHVNGDRREVTDSWLGESLLDVLRDRLGLIGTKGACEQGECGSCSVLVDDVLVCSCLVMAASAVGQRIVTIEGVAPVGAPSDVQRGVRRSRCRPMRVLHARVDHGGPRPARTFAACRPTPRSARNWPATCVAAPGTGASSTPSSRWPVARAAGARHDRSSSPAPDATVPRHGSDRHLADAPDGIAKVQGSFEFSSDISADGCLWGATLRSPHPYARIRSIDVGGAWKIAGVETVITAADVPGELHLRADRQDQPVFADDVVRYVGEPVAAVAADDPETCRRALDAIVVDYEVLDAACSTPRRRSPATTSRSTPTAT